MVKAVKVFENPEIWQIPVDLPQSPLKNLNSYVICTPEKNLVIDTGFNRAECREALWAGIREIGLDMGKTALFLTHSHTDHIGLVQDFVDLGCTVYMGELDHLRFRTFLEGNVRAQMDALYCTEGFPEEEIALQAQGNQNRRYMPTKFFPATELHDGDKIMLGDVEAVCIHTPGHSAGSCSFIDPKRRILFSGDACNVSLRITDCDVETALEGLMRLKAQQADFDRNFNGHLAYASGVTHISMPESTLDDCICAMETILAGKAEPIVKFQSKWADWPMVASYICGAVTVTYCPTKLRKGEA